MAHTYVVTSAIPTGFITQIIGTVDGIPVTVNVSTSDVAIAQAAGLTALKNLAAAAMQVVAFPPQPVVITSPLPTGTFTQ